MKTIKKNNNVWDQKLTFANVNSSYNTVRIIPYEVDHKISI